MGIVRQTQRHTRKFTFCMQPPARKYLCILKRTLRCCKLVSNAHATRTAPKQLCCRRLKSQTRIKPSNHSSKMQQTGNDWVFKHQFPVKISNRGISPCLQMVSKQLISYNSGFEWWESRWHSWFHNMNFIREPECDPNATECSIMQNETRITTSVQYWKSMTNNAVLKLLDVLQAQLKLS